uniref:Sugar transporter SWEET1 n=1 Tax=Pyrodinium bahamense TaxID=73915 RepID=A0A7S0AE51_9DINO|mmetsp:Transcript_32126/g.88614  ORF Transcript_32126/g.88614 Transcript_32126/m.88614 type:complete len:434 (+) Transcript_32126:84-1385(+)
MAPRSHGGRPLALARVLGAVATVAGPVACHAAVAAQALGLSQRRPLPLAFRAGADHRAAALEAWVARLPGAWTWTKSLINEPDLVSDPDTEGAPDLGASLLLLSSVHSGVIAKVNVTSAQLVDAARAEHSQAKNAKSKLTPRSWFALTFSFAFVIKASCMFSNVLFQISPIPQVRQFSKFKDTGEVDAAPFISILYGGCQWCFYGFFAFVVTKKSGFLVLVYSNILGAFLGIYYVWGFQYNCRNKQTLRKLFMYYRLVSTLALLQVVAMVVLEKQQALFFSGLVSSVCSVVGACSLLTTLPTVLQTRCSATINVPLLTVGVLSGLLWLACGFILWDAWIVVPNLICLVVQCVTVGVVLYFPRDPARAVVAVTAAGPPAAGLLPSSAEAEEEAEAVPLPVAPLPAGTLAGPVSSGQQQRDYGTTKILGETGGTF